MKVVAGYCQRCFAPFYVEMGISQTGLPAVIPSCNCWNNPQIIRTDNSTKYNLKEGAANEQKSREY